MSKNKECCKCVLAGKKFRNKDGELKKIIEPGNYGIIMIDSVTQLVPLEMVHKAIDENTRLAALAAVMSTGLKKVVSAMSLVQSKTILFFVNQTRANIGQMFGKKLVRTGGNALPFYDTIALNIWKVGKSEERDEKGKIFAHQVAIKFEKNKAGQLPAEPIVFRLRYDGTGIDNMFELYSVAEMNGLIAKFKRKYNFIKPGTGDLIDETIENWNKKDFEEVLKQNPKIKEMIDNFIKEGAFYSNEKELLKDGEEDKKEEKKEGTRIRRKKSKSKND